MYTHIRIVLLTLLVSVSGNALANNDQVFSGIHAFGTSLSDEGNAFIGCGMQSVPPYENLTEDNLYVAPGDSPYARGGHHFSNGSTWVEPLAKSLGVNNSALPVRRNPIGTNYAQAGTTAFPENVGPPFEPLPCRVSFETQIENALARGAIPSDALVAVEIGSNDVINALFYFLYLQSLGVDIPTATEQAVMKLEEAAVLTAAGIKELIDNGASTVLWANVPDIGLTPAIALLDEQLGGSGLIKTTATQFAFLFNLNVRANPDIQSAIADGTLVKLDLFTILQDLVASGNGLNVTDTCVTPNEYPFACENPDDYLFWDGIHPTKAIHAFFSEKAIEALSL